MKNTQLKKFAQIVKADRNRRTWRKIVQFMACIVVFVTTYVLILPAVTAEKEYFCGFDAHEHTAECYIQETEETLICSLGEISAEPDESPPEEAETGDSGDSGATAEPDESPPHIHGEGCYEITVNDVLICGFEIHVHDETCRSNPEADLETAEDWEQTLANVEFTGDWAKDLVSVASSQVGYHESEKNYLAEEGKPNRGYSRYGAWYKIPYGEWNAMFASFCISYAGIPSEVIAPESESEKLLEALRNNPLTELALEKVPETGDLLFYRENADAPLRVAIVLNFEEGSLLLIEGDRENQVSRHSLELGDIVLQGCCGIAQVQKDWEAMQNPVPEEPPDSEEPEDPEENEEKEEAEKQEIFEQPVYTAETENYSVSILCSILLPEGTELRVSEYPEDSDVFLRRCGEAGYNLEWLLNIGFFLEDTEQEIDAEFRISVTDKRGNELGRDIVHFTPEGAERFHTYDIPSTWPDDKATVTFGTEGFSDFGGGVAMFGYTPETFGAPGDEVVRFNFVTADPNQLRENTDYVIYTGSGTSLNFMSSRKTPVLITGSDGNSPYQVGRNWNLTTSVMGTSQVNDMSWRIVRSGNEYYLRSQATGAFMRLHNGWSSMESQNNASRLRNSNINGASVLVGDGTYHIRYENNEWKSTWTNNSGYWTQPTTIYFAEVRPVYESEAFPNAVYTGDVHIDRLRFYNICEGAQSGVTALAGCVFRIEGTTSLGQKYSTTIVSGESPQIALPHDIPDGTYTITQVSAPDGYMRDMDNVRDFRIQNGTLASSQNIGTFLNHALEKLTLGKTGEVEDYNNRIYEIMLHAKTNLSMYYMDPIEVLFLVDKSNSMLFPASLNPLGKQITLRTDDANNINNNRAVFDSLDKSVLHYIIADPNGSATVYALWHNGSTWLYQDASYYVKAKFENAEGYGSAGETVIFPEDRSYGEQADWEDETFGEEYRSNGGGITKSMVGSTLGTFIENNGGQYPFQLYTSDDPYNRLHYLEEALANMIYQLADANHENKVIIIPFTKEVQGQINYPVGSNNAFPQPITLTTENAEKLFDIVTHINTSGGTRQDLALEYAYETYLNKWDGFDQRHTYTVLVTDGAPARSGSSSPNLGSPNSAPTTADNGEIYGRIKGWGAEVRKESTLMSVAIGMEDVQGGKQVLQDIASNNEFYSALDDASALTSAMQKILFDGMKDQGNRLINESLIEDEISESFYPIAWVNSANAAGTGRTVLTQSGGKAWILLQPGDWITPEGAFTTAGANNADGQLLQRDDGTYFIRWVDRVISDSGWNGKFYVKAKEDFIGGNAVNTNKSAYITVYDATIPVESPTVNVHLMDLNENSSETTVYLGDTVNSPRDLLKDFYDQIRFTKVFDETNIPDLRNMNRFNPDADAEDGLERNFFYLKYALGYRDGSGNWVPRELTDDEWATLEAGGSLILPYNYAGTSGNGPVGHFTVSLSKTSDTYETHAAENPCQPEGSPPTENCNAPAERYSLSVTYTAYELGEHVRPPNNVNNGTGSPGTEVTAGRQGLNNGQGIITSENTHDVHVISGRIVVNKVFREGAPWEEGESFTFILTDQNGEAQSQTVTIDSGGTATAVFDRLPRGTYTVTEAIHEDFAVKNVNVHADTNCYYQLPDPVQVSFTLGSNPDNQNVIGKLNETDIFTEYIDPGNGVYGEATFTNDVKIHTGQIPVAKIWDDGNENHNRDRVYLVLYLDDQPLLDTEGRARIIALDADSGWKGSFTVVLADENDTVDNYNYSVREVANISQEELHEWQSAVLEPDGQTILYYDRALESGGLIGVSGKGYIAQYAIDEDGTLVVKNCRGYDLPKTGGIGTYPYTIGGLFAIASALILGYSLRCRRKRGESG